MRLRLEKVVPWGRSLQEYIQMFDLTNDDLQCTPYSADKLMRS